MRIGIDIRMLGADFGGIGRYVFELVKHVLSADWENKYYLFYNNRTSDKELVRLLNKSNVDFVTANYRHYSLKEQVLFLKLLNKYNLDLVHFPNFNLPIFYRKPFVVTIHDMVHHKLGGAKKSNYLSFLAYKEVMKSAVLHSEKIITVSENSKKDILQFYNVDSKKIKVIYSGATVDAKVTEKEIEKVKEKYLLKRPFLLFVGVLERKKNLIDLTKGFDEFINKYKLDIDLVIAGKVDRHYPNIKFNALKIKNANRLVFTDYVEEKDLAALYRGAFAYINASKYEGFGLPGAEAMKIGLPLVVSNTPVFNEIYDNAAIYFNPDDPSDIAEKIDLLINDNLFYNKLQENGLSRSQLFNWNKTAKETLSLYNQIINK